MQITQPLLSTCSGSKLRSRAMGFGPRLSDRVAERIFGYLPPSLFWPVSVVCTFTTLRRVWRCQSKLGARTTVSKCFLAKIVLPQTSSETLLEGRSECIAAPEAGASGFTMHNLTSKLRSGFSTALKKVTEEQIHSLVSGLEMPEPFRPQQVVSFRPYDPARSEFHILDHVPKGRRSGKDYRTKCPSCSMLGRDKNNDNLAVSVSDPRKYKCWAGCKKEEIRAALGCPIKPYGTHGAWQRTHLNA